MTLNYCPSFQGSSVDIIVDSMMSTKSKITLNYPHFRRPKSVVTRSHKLDDSTSSMTLNWIAQTLGHELCQNISLFWHQLISYPVCVKRSDNKASGTERVPKSSSITTGLWSRG